MKTELRHREHREEDPRVSFVKGALTHYRFVPKYSVGSPGNFYGTGAEVRLRQLAHGEKNSYERHLAGVYGEVSQKRAEEEGLDGIAEIRWESRLNYRGPVGFLCEDIYTERRWFDTVEQLAKRED